MDSKYYEKHIANIPGFPKEGIIFRDITTTLEDKEAFHNMIMDMCNIARKYDCDKVMAADARGFIVGSPVAYELNRGFVIARKPNKLPRPGRSCTYNLEYGTNTLEISKGALKKGDRVLIVDDLLATGGSSKAMMDIAINEGAIPVAAIFYIELVDFKAAQEITAKYNIPVHSLVKYEGE